MEITKTIEPKNRYDFRIWLEWNHSIEKDIWLIFHKKHTKKETISYNDAVEEAICFGWIDTTVKRLNSDSFAQRFTPRKNHLNWSKPNIERAQKMIAQKKIKKFALDKFHEYLKSDKKQKRADISPKIVREFEEMLKKSKKALEFYNNLAPSYRKMYQYHICSAKKRETQISRMKKSIGFFKKGKKILY